MPKPRVFVSSAYVGLADLRATLYRFLEEQGYEPVLFEKGGIGFDHSIPLDESCYKAVADCDLFILIMGGRYGSPTSAGSKTRLKTYNSITKQEYLTAREADIPIYTFVDANVHSEYGTWHKNPQARATLSFAHVDNQLIFALLKEIYGLHKNNLVQTYGTVEDIIVNLRSQLAAIVQRYAASRRRKGRMQAVVRINPYKLFFYRQDRGMSNAELADKLGMKRSALRHLETLDETAGALTAATFPSCEMATLEQLERALQTPGVLIAGQPDDFLSVYIHYYAMYKTKHFPSVPGRLEEVVPTRAVVFDFDGTLTQHTDDETTWEKLWKRLGYSINECARFHAMFTRGEITHEEWCHITLRKFRDRGLQREHVLEMAHSMKLVAGTAPTLAKLRDHKIRLYILSGSIRLVIRELLGDLEDMFSDVRANEFQFDADGGLVDIVGTRFDFEGKAEYLRTIMTRDSLDPLEVLFVGNSLNDVYASLSGARTLCVNPSATDPERVEHWTYFIRKMLDLSEVLPFVDSRFGSILC